MRTAPQKETAIFFFFFYIIFMFLVLINIFLAILNDAYAYVKAQMEERAQARAAEREAAEASGELKPKKSLGARLRALRDVAKASAGSQSRFARFRNRVMGMRKRRKEGPPTGVYDFD